jgi:hypothetical protein
VFLPLIIISVAVWYTINLSEKGKIINPERFIDFLSIKILLSTLIYFLFWYKPLSALGILTIDSQENNLGFQDSMFYQFHAASVSQLDFSEWISASRVTWQSEGVIVYIAIINRLFGDELYNVIIVNILLGYLSVLQLCKIGNIGRLGKSHYALVWPHTLYYDVPPGKEALTNFVLFCIIAMAYEMFVADSKIKAGKVAGLLFFLSILSFVRINLVILLIVAIFFAVVVSGKKLLLPALLLIFLTTVIYVLFGDFMSIYLDAIFEKGINVSESADLEDNSIKTLISTLLNSLPAVIRLLLSPVYAAIWLLSPLPFIGLDRMYSAFIEGNSYAQFTFAPYFFRVLGSIWIAMAVLNPRTWEYVVMRYKDCDAYKFLFLVAVVLTLSIAYSNLVQGARYRVIVEPMIFLLSGSFLSRSGVSVKRWFTVKLISS